MRRTLLVLSLGVLSLNACGGKSEETAASSTRDSHDAVIEADKSTLTPPPAWIETEAGSRRLTLSTYCWNSETTGVCADYDAASCQEERVPKVAIREGERVRFHLGFAPRTVTLHVAGTRPTSYRLQPMKVAEWNAEGELGPATLYARSQPGLTRGGDASYVACLQPR